MLITRSLIRARQGCRGHHIFQSLIGDGDLLLPRSESCSIRERKVEVNLGIVLYTCSCRRLGVSGSRWMNLMLLQRVIPISIHIQQRIGRKNSRAYKKKKELERYLNWWWVTWVPGLYKSQKEITESRIQAELPLNDSRPLYSYSDGYGLQMVMVSAR